MNSTRLESNLSNAAACEVCILAGGLSSRMGRDKARLRLGGKSLLAHVRVTARKTGWPVRVLRRDRVPRCGPLGGVYSALATARADAVVLLSCDMPFITARLLAELGGKLAARAGAVFVTSRGMVGFPFILRRSALPVVERQMRQGRFSLQTLARRLAAGTLRLPRARAHELFNVNTPADLDAARVLWRRLRSARAADEESSPRPA